MAVVPWTYNNPRVDQRTMATRGFIFQGQLVEVTQDIGAEIDVTRNTGLKLWDGAYILSRVLENTRVFPPKFWNGRRCIELGSGCGLVGMVAWLLGAEVVLTDLPSTLDHTTACVQSNIERLARGNRDLRVEHVNVRSYIWGGDADGFACPFDFVLGSDIVYNPETISSLVTSLELLCGPDTVTLISYKPRGLGEETFFPQLTQRGFNFEEISRDYHPLDFKDSDYKIIRIVKG